MKKVRLSLWNGIPGLRNDKKHKVEVKSPLFVLFGNSYLCICPYFHPSLLFLTTAFSDYRFFPSLSTKIFT